MALNVTVWHEYVHEHKNPKVAEFYPDGMHAAMKAAIEEHLGQDVNVTTATLRQDDQHGLSDELLAKTDVMTWWGHAAHGEVKDEIVDKVHRRVLEGMGLVVLHSGHFSKIFKKLCGTTCALRWREAAEKERIWCVNPGHPVADGLDDEFFELEHTEMYGEFFDIPEPDELVFVSWFEGGEIFRSGFSLTRGKGKVFYWRPGHETFPLYYNKHVKRVMANAVKYVAPRSSAVCRLDGRNVPKDESLSPIAAVHEVDESLHKH